VPNLYHIILLYSVEPCAPSCTFSVEPTCIDWHPLHCPSCLRSRSFHFGGLPVHALVALYLSPILLHLALVAPSCHPQIHSPSIQYAHSHSAFGHIAVSLVDFPLPLYLSILLLSHAATYTSLYLQSVHSNHHRSAHQKRLAFTAERTSLNLEPPLPYLVVPSAFALWSSFFIPCPGI